MLVNPAIASDVFPAMLASRARLIDANTAQSLSADVTSFTAVVYFLR